MSDVSPSSVGRLPSSQKLLRSTLIAAATALVLLVTVVMPAEYGVDPTGVGRLLGLTEMGKIKVQLAKEAAADAAADAAAGPSARTANTAAAAAPVKHQTQNAVAKVIPDSVTTSATPPKTDELSVTLRPNEGKEVKLARARETVDGTLPHAASAEPDRRSPKRGAGDQIPWLRQGQVKTFGRRCSDCSL